MENGNGKRYTRPKISVSMLIMVLLIGVIVFLLIRDKPNDKFASEQTAETETPSSTTTAPSETIAPPTPSVDIEPVLEGVYLGFDLQAYQYSSENWGWKPYETKNSVLMGGNKYYKAMIFQGHSASPFAGTSSASFNLDGKYSKIQGRYGHVDGSADIAETITIYGDDICMLEIEAKPTDFGVYFEINVTDVHVLRIDVPFSAYSSDTFYALAEMELVQ